MRKYNPDTHPVIAIDLYGTILDKKTNYLPFPNSIETINEMINEGYEVIILTEIDGKVLKSKIFELIDNFRLNPNVKINQQSNYYSSLNEELPNKILASIYLDKNSYHSPDYSKEWINIRREFI